MTLETGLIWAIAIMTVGAIGLAGFAIWLRKKPRYPRDDGPLSEAASERIRQIAQPMLQKGPVISERTIDDWLAENKQAIERSNNYVERHGLPLGTLRGSVVRYEDPATPVDVEWDAEQSFSPANPEREAGMLKGKIVMAEDFDAPLPDDIQGGFDGTSQPWVRTPEEQAWLDIMPVGREFGSPDHDRLMEIDAQKERDKENE